LSLSDGRIISVLKHEATLMYYIRYSWLKPFHHFMFQLKDSYNFISDLFLLIDYATMLKLGWQYLGTKRRRCGYEKLTSSSEKMMRDGRRCWVKSVNGRLRGLRLSRCRKLSLLFSSRIVRLYTEVVNTMNMENIYPAIVLSTQWGLPVLSHSSHVCRSKRTIPLHRKLTFC